MSADIIQTEHLRKVFPYVNPDPNSNDADMWFSYIGGLLGRGNGPFAARRGTIVALDDVSLTVRKGEFLAILGPNGAGKTTLVKILTAILWPTAGRAVINGFDVRHDPARVRSSISVVPAAGWLAFDAHLTVNENLIYWARLYGLTPGVAAERIRTALEIVGLDGWLNEKPSHLSSGMRQRLAVAKGLLFRAPVFILDEPTANIDPVGADQIRDFLRNELNRRLGQTVVLTTHNMAEAEQLSDRVAIVNHGRVMACDTPVALTSGLRDDVVELTVASCLPQAHRVLVERGLAAHVGTHLDPDGKGLLRVHRHPTASVDDIRAALEAVGVEVHGVAPATPTLEDVFRQFTDGGNNANVGR